jgi:hypothetical protein
MRRSRLAVASLVLAGVSVSCYKPLYFPPSGPIKLAVVVRDMDGKCKTETFPQYQPVRRKDVLTWNIFGVGQCASTDEVRVQFPPDSNVVSLKHDKRQITGTVVGERGGRYKYSILIGKDVVEDPEIEIWP